MIRVLSTGISSRWQDLGRPGLRHLGIAPNFPLDEVALRLCNILLQNPTSTPVIECFFPAVSLFFEQSSIICITGGDFDAQVNNVPVPTHQLIYVPKYSTLQFNQPKKGRCIYIGIKGGVAIQSWQGSATGSHYLDKHTISVVEKNQTFSLLQQVPASSNNVLFGRYFIANYVLYPSQQTVPIILHPNIPQTENFIQALTQNSFSLSNQFNRMGILLNPSVQLNWTLQMNYSVGVDMGAVQVLPNGKWMVLLSDHGITGGYPILGYIPKASLGNFMQHGSNALQFEVVSIDQAKAWRKQQLQMLNQINHSASIYLEQFLKKIVR